MMVYSVSIEVQWNQSKISLESGPGGEWGPGRAKVNGSRIIFFFGSQKLPEPCH
jgi:hypothetical protein